MGKKWIFTFGSPYMGPFPKNVKKTMLQYIYYKCNCNLKYLIMEILCNKIVKYI